MSELTIYEVGPRDGLQYENITIGTYDKILFINILSKNFNHLLYFF